MVTKLRHRDATLPRNRYAVSKAVGRLLCVPSVLFNMVSRTKKAKAHQSGLQRRADGEVRDTILSHMKPSTRYTSKYLEKDIERKIEFGATPTQEKSKSILVPGMQCYGGDHT